MPTYDPRGGGGVHIDVALSNISVARTNQSWNVSDALFPSVRVKKQSDKYYIFGREAWRPPMGGTVRAPGTKANQVPGLRVSLDQYFAIEHALEGDVTPEERENADSPMAPDRDATENVTNKILLGRELEARDLVHDPDTYIPEHVFTLSGGAQFDDYTNSDPMSVFREAQRVFHKTMFTVPNIAVIPWDVMWWLSDHPKLRDRLGGDERSVLTEQDVANLLGVRRVLVPGGGFNREDNAGGPEDIGYLWSQHIVLAWVPARPARRTPAFGYEFVWPIGGRVQTTDKRNDKDNIKDIIRVRRRYDLKIVAKDDDATAGGDPGTQSIAGMLIEDAISDAAAAA